MLSDLRANGLIAGRKTNTEILDYRRMLTLWCEAYPQRLRPKLLRGTFAHDDPFWWDQFDPRKIGALWGGEVAARLLVGYLKPANATLYYHGDITDLVRAARLRKANEGVNVNVEVLEPFWKQEEAIDRPKTVDPLLVFADLISVGDPRTLEAADLIYEQEIGRRFEQA
ncbi:MAG: type IV toxin-antitoxin system AbiEi family antitoxin [Gammaproteobacteria bacterium]|nr:type IV toxin-antitoxin system AbiEi family antitoxin [Gammaproteobacteria bacterium]